MSVGGGCTVSWGSSSLSSDCTRMLMFSTRYMAPDIHGNCGGRHSVIFFSPPSTSVLRRGGRKGGGGEKGMSKGKTESAKEGRAQRRETARELQKLLSWVAVHENRSARLSFCGGWVRFSFPRSATGITRLPFGKERPPEGRKKGLCGGRKDSLLAEGWCACLRPAQDGAAVREEGFRLHRFRVSFWLRGEGDQQVHLKANPPAAVP